MRKFYFILLAFIAAAFLPSCSLCAVDGGEEGVFIKQPLFFGDGGVQEQALTQGSEWKVFSTNFVIYSTVNTRYSVSFDDIATDETTPLDITAHIFLKIKEGKSPILHKNYGPNWYENNIKDVFSKHIRNFVSMHDMRTLISERDCYETIEKELRDDMTDHITELSKTKELPIEVVNIVIDKAKPNKDVLDELNNTAIYMQQKQTELMKQAMQVERKKTEHLRALADKEYQRTMGFTPQQFISLRALELENQKIEMIKNKNNVNVDVMLGNSTPMWDIKQK